jgi:hypothetical protein
MIRQAKLSTRLQAFVETLATAAGFPATPPRAPDIDVDAIRRGLDEPW